MRPPDFWGRDGGPLGAVLAPLGWCYGAGTRLRFALARPWKAPMPVLCVGNLVAGGAGKTPVALALGRHLASRGKKAHFLGRGYGGSATTPVAVDPKSHDADRVGDEALLLARLAPTWVSTDRVAGTRAAAHGADVVVMDDGFQDPSVEKDLSLLVVDGRRGFGNRRMIPAGPLREPVGGALSRASALVVVGPDEAGVERDADVRAAGVRVMKARLRAGPEAGRLGGKRVVAFAGIGDPDKFFATLEGIGCALADAVRFADHHPFTAADIRRLRAEVARLDATLVTTEKDAVRLPPDERDDIEVLTITVEWEDEAALDAILGPLFDG